MEGDLEEEEEVVVVVVVVVVVELRLQEEWPQGGNMLPHILGRPYTGLPHVLGLPHILAEEQGNSNIPLGLLRLSLVGV